MVVRGAIGISLAALFSSFPPQFYLSANAITITDSGFDVRVPAGQSPT